MSQADACANTGFVPGRLLKAKRRWRC